jgi:hypothetical protein
MVAPAPCSGRQSYCTALPVVDSSQAGVGLVASVVLHIRGLNM